MQRTKKVRFSPLNNSAEIPLLSPQQKKALFMSPQDYEKSRKDARIYRFCPLNTSANPKHCPYFTYKCYNQKNNTCFNVYDMNDFIPAAVNAPLDRKQILLNQQFKQKLDQWVAARQARQLRLRKQRAKKVLLGH